MMGDTISDTPYAGPRRQFSAEVATVRKRRTGTFLGVPYDWRWPTAARIKERVWNPNDRRLLTPHVMGWGYTLNFYELLRRLGVIRRP